jgi:hypothetical protein
MVEVVQGEFNGYPTLRITTGDWVNKEGQKKSDFKKDINGGLPKWKKIINPAVLTEVCRFVLKHDNENDFAKDLYLFCKEYSGKV